MAIQSRWTTPVPLTDIPTHIFGTPNGSLPDIPMYMDCDDPNKLKLTLKDYREWSKRLAAGLLDVGGLADGDRVMVVSGNSIFLPVALMGTLMAGGIFCTANPAFTPRELAYQIRDSDAKFVLVTEPLIPCAIEAMTQLGRDYSQIYVFDDSLLATESSTMPPRTDKIRHWAQLVATPAAGVSFRWTEFTTPAQADRTALLIYSSGTTGLPKGVEASHRNLIANNCQFIHLQRLDPRLRQLDQTGAATSLACLPMYHGLGLIVYVLLAPKRRMKVYMMKRYDGDKVLLYIERFLVTELMLVPPILVAMAKNPKAKMVDLSSIRRVTCGAAPMGREVSAQFEHLWSKGQINVKQAWGMSEFPCIGLGWDNRETSTSASVGELLANCEAKLVAEDGETEIRDPEQRGELWVRGPNVMKGYWRNPAATRDTITPDGWLKTGDVAYRDAKNKFYIADRKKELIKVRGAQVAPAELEALLEAFPGVRDAAVIGVKTADGEDEQPRGYVVRTDTTSASPSEQDLLAYVAKNVAKVKRITGGIIFVGSVPRNPSGKILRKELRALAARSDVRRTGPKI